jgi:hypothetical protein
MKLDYAEMNVYPHRIYLNRELDVLLNSIFIDLEIRPAYWIDHHYSKKDEINYKYINLVKKYIPDVDIHYGKVQKYDKKLHDIVLIHKKQKIPNIIYDSSTLGHLFGYTCVDEYVKWEEEETRKRLKYNSMILCKIKYENKEYYMNVISYMCNTLINAKKGKKFETKANKMLEHIKEKYKKIFKHYKFEIIEFFFTINN